MATSGSTTISTTVAQIITTAYNLTGHVGADLSSPASADVTLALRLLNDWCKYAQSFGGFLWKRSVAYLFMPSNQTTFILGGGDSDHITESYNTTTLTAAADASATTLTVSSTSGMANDDIILITLADGTFQSPAPTVTVTDSTTLTLSTGTDEALSSGARIFTYTSKIDNPFHVYGVGLRTYGGSSFTDKKRELITFDDYFLAQTDKTSLGEAALQAAYLPRRGFGQLFIRGRNSSPSSAILMVILEKVLEDFATDTVDTDEPDFPYHWVVVVENNLAYQLSRALEMEPAVQNLLREEADRTMQQALANDAQWASLKLRAGR